MVYFAGKRVDNDSVEDRLGTAVVEGGTNSMAYFPYGELRSGTSTEVQFATYKRDSTTNLDYAHNRYYSSQIARFTTPDPGGSASTEAPQSFNRYGYVAGDPANMNDPTGLFGYCPAWEDCPSFAVRESGGMERDGALGGDTMDAEAAYAESVQETIADANTQAAMLLVSAVLKDAAAQFAAALLSGLFTEECGADMYALGISAEDWAAKLTSVSIVLGPGSTDPVAPTWPSGQPQPQNIDKVTVGTQFTKGTGAISDPNGPKVYINPYSPGMDPANAQAMAGMIAHETLHKLGPGMAVDTDIQGVLGLTVDEHKTQNISDQLAQDCFPMTPSAAPILLP
jgi:RHS repeat-associated protein